MIKWIMINLVCRFFGHIEGDRIPLFVPWKGTYDDNPYWDNIKSKINENIIRSIPVCQVPGNGGICQLKMFHEGPHDFCPEGGVATAINEPLSYSSPSIFSSFNREVGSINCKRCGTMIGEYGDTK